MQGAGVQECACDDPERLASLLGLDAAKASVGDRVAAQAPVPGQVLARLDRARAATPGEHLGKEDDCVEADQHVGQQLARHEFPRADRRRDQQFEVAALTLTHDRDRGL